MLYNGEAAMERGGVVGTQVGGAIAFYGGMSLNELLAIGGFLLAVASFMFQVAVTLYFKQKHLKLAEARLAAELDPNGGDDDEH